MSGAQDQQKMAALVESARQHLTANYRPAPIVLEQGQGATVRDVAGTRYVDLVAGVAVSSLGHGHPRVRQVLLDRADKVLHTSNLYYNQPAIELARRLTELTFADRIFLCQSGTEANEAAFKLARKYHRSRGDDRFEVVSTLGSFHGRSMGALSLTGQPKYHQGFEPMVPGIRHIPYGDIAALDAALTPTTAAVFLEPIQGEGGVRVPPDGYLAAARELCNQRGALLVLDEVQTGVGRTGHFLACQRDGVVPDILTLAKGLAAGLPLGATLAREEVAAALVPGSHASTFGGNPLCCAMACAVIDEISAPAMLQRIRQLGDLIGARLSEWCRRYPFCVEARGRGLLWGLELSQPLPSLVDQARARGVLTNLIGEKVVRCAPPLVIREDELDAGLSALEAALTAAAGAA